MVKKVKVKQKLKVLRFRENAMLPERATEGSAGLDLHACIDEPMTIGAGERVVIPTGIGIELPGPDYVAFIIARSGLGIRHGLTLSNGVGVVDSDYRGEIIIGLSNFSTEPYELRVQERVAQMVVVPVSGLTIEAVDSLSKTERGTAGFGSTGRGGEKTETEKENEVPVPEKPAEKKETQE